MEISIYEIIGWIALALNVWGNLYLAKKTISGWLIRLACNVAWIIYSIYFRVDPLLVNHIIFAFINIYGWREWSKNVYICNCGRRYDLSEKNRPVCLCEMPIKQTVKRG